MGFPISAIASPRLRRNVGLLVAVLLAAPAFSSSPARADPPPQRIEQPVRAGPLAGGLRMSLKLLKWLVKYVPAVRGLIDAIEEVLRVMDDVRRAADVERKMSDLNKRLAELEAQLSRDANPRAAQARIVVRKLRTEISARHTYKPCGFARHRNEDGECADRRDVELPTAPK